MIWIEDAERRNPSMKILIAIIVALAVAGSLFADYKWRQWMAARRHDRDRNP